MIIGAILNALAIVIGAFAGRFRKSDVGDLDQNVIKKFIGIFMIYAGLKLTWDSLGGGLIHVLKQMLIIVLGMSFGKILGKILGFQRLSNHIGRFATARLENPKAGRDGLVVPTLLFCVAPLGILGAVADGLNNYPYPLIIKGVMDGMAAFAFVRSFGIIVAGSALPLLAFLGTITLSSRAMEPWLRTYDLTEPILATTGLLVFCVAMVVLELKRFELADYLPSLAAVPILAYFLGW